MNDCPGCKRLAWQLEEALTRLAEERAAARRATDLMVKGEMMRDRLMLQAITGQFPPKGEAAK